jgi:hypothetical protein
MLKISPKKLYAKINKYQLERAGREAKRTNEVVSDSYSDIARHDLISLDQHALVRRPQITLTMNDQHLKAILFKFVRCALGAGRGHSYI